MRYFIDAEFNGFGGQLISLALVPEDDEAVLLRSISVRKPELLGHGPRGTGLTKQLISRPEMISKLATYLRGDSGPVVTADWPEDIAHLALLILTGPGWRMPSPRLIIELT